MPPLLAAYDLFGHLRLHGEWFRPADELVTFIRTHANAWTMWEQGDRSPYGKQPGHFG